MDFSRSLESSRSTFTSSPDVIVIGGGAAGLMCAIEAGKRGRRVLLLEHNDRIGKKIAISGGGRCNFTNLNTSPANFLSANPDFCKSALARYTPADFVALVEKHRVPFHEKKLGQQFCDTSSRAIIDVLLAECAAAHVDIRVNCRVESVEKPERFRIATNHGAFESVSLVIASGGLSFSKLAASGFGYRAARRVADALGGHRGLLKSRSEARRRGHRRPLIENDGSARSSRPLFRRRSSRCHRLARRLQFPVGLGFGPRGRTIRVDCRRDETQFPVGNPRRSARHLR